MDSGWLTTGKVTHDFESEFSAFVGSKHALAVNSNTSGMILAMEACGVAKGKAVITTPYTFVSTAASAIHLGADVYFADIEKDSYSISAESIEKILEDDAKNGHKVVAIVPVHVAGNLCDMKKINALAAKFSTPKNKIRVIEDAAHAFPSKTPDGFAGTLGDIGVFSFYATKTMTTGEGGMITTNDDSLAKRMVTMRLHGMNRDAWDRYTSSKASWEYDIVAPGFKSNLPDVLSALDFVQLPPDGEGNAWHLYLLQIVPEKLTCTRNEFAKALQDEGLGISMHFIAIYNFSWWKEAYPANTPDKFPNAERHWQNTVTIPLWPYMDEETSDYVIETVKKVGEKFHA